MESFLKADRKEPNPEIVAPADHLCNLCDGNERGLYAEMLRESEDAEAEISDEARQNKGLPCGVKPNGKEIEEHNRTHLPFRSWCKHCVFGKGQSHPHYQKEKEEIGIPCISWDYMYMKGDGSKYEEEDIKDELPIVVWKDNMSKAEGAFVVPSKGDCEYAIRRGAQDVNKILGYNKMISKGDQEPALRTMMERMKMMCGDQCTLDETPVGDSQSNGSIESTIKQVQGQFRTMRGALESRYGKEISPKSNAMTWLVRHAGGTLFRNLKGKDGFTSYRRIKGEEFH